MRSPGARDQTLIFYTQKLHVPQFFLQKNVFPICMCPPSSGLARLPRFAPPPLPRCMSITQLRSGFPAPASTATARAPTTEPGLKILNPLEPMTRLPSDDPTPPLDVEAPPTLATRAPLTSLAQGRTPRPAGADVCLLGAEVQDSTVIGTAMNFGDSHIRLPCALPCVSHPPATRLDVWLPDPSFPHPTSPLGSTHLKRRPAFLGRVFFSYTVRCYHSSLPQGEHAEICGLGG
jgi:hypothetical protein